MNPQLFFFYPLFFVPFRGQDRILAKERTTRTKEDEIEKLRRSEPFVDMTLKKATLAP